MHFPDDTHATSLTAARTCRRSLERLTRLRALTRLQRRIGGIRAGSAAYLYVLGPIGQRLLDPDAPRRVVREPSLLYLAHTLAITDAFVELTLAARQGRFELLSVTHEPGCWRSFFGPNGATSWIKPDLAVTIGTSDRELSWFLEVDRGTEHAPALRRKGQAYLAAYQYGNVTTQEGVFPRVLWLVPDQRRAAALVKALPRSELSEQLFVVTTTDDLLSTAQELTR
ncbi:MAG: replication-relaxation family protein [Actinomycetota bacterium]|nr:replication-relaxation family protein [Actinomycetota bacterium]